MLQFFIGFVVGALAAIIVLSLCMSSKQREQAYEDPEFWEKMK